MKCSRCYTEMYKICSEEVEYNGVKVRETTIVCPCCGKTERFIDEPDLERLQLGKVHAGVMSILCDMVW